MWTLADEPMRLVTGDALPPGPMPMWAIVAWTGAAILAALLLVAILGVRWWISQPQTDLAFISMSRRLGLSRTDRRVVEHLAELSGVHPVAMLVSRHAFAVAAQSAIQTGSRVVGPARIAGVIDKFNQA
ncbi:MAG: hypothetical protein AABZ53_01730 [Planctomycetota bacterium]